MSQRSPLTNVDRIKRPLLVYQGGKDPVVNQAPTGTVIDAPWNSSPNGSDRPPKQDLELPVTYLLYPDEGHGFSLTALISFSPS